MKPQKDGMLNLITKGSLGRHFLSLSYIPSTSQILSVVQGIKSSPWGALSLKYGLGLKKRYKTKQLFHYQKKKKKSGETFRLKNKNTLK